MQNGTDIVNVNVINRTNETFLFYNSSQRIDTGQIQNQLDSTVDTIGNRGVIPDLYIWGFLSVIVLIGTFLNCLAIYALLRAKYNGTRYFLLQLSFCDLGAILISVLELHYTNNRKWLFPEELCPIYLGLESFISTATIYFIVAINFHAISMHNLALKALQKQDKLDNEYTELATATDQTTTDDDNYEIAITDQDQQKRSLTIDYSRKKNAISVILPALFIWFLAASISIPFFVFGDVIPNEINPLICGVINFDKHNNHLMQTFVILIRIVISTGCLHFTSIYILKIYFVKSKIENCELDENIATILKLSLILSISYTILSLQRLYGSLLFEVITTPFMHYKYPRLDQATGLGFNMISFLLPSFRPIIYFAIDKNMISTAKI